MHPIYNNFNHLYLDIIVCRDKLRTNYCDKFSLLPKPSSNVHFLCGSCICGLTSANVQKQYRKWVQLSRLLCNDLSKMVHDLWVYSVTFGGFQAYKTDFRLITKHGNSVNPNLSLYNTKVVLSLAAHQNYHGYV